MNNEQTKTAKLPNSSEVERLSVKQDVAGSTPASAANSQTTQLPTRSALMKCAEWLVFCLSIGWPKSDLDDLEKLWWKGHDWRGRLRSVKR